MLLDGVFVMGADGVPVFRALSRLDTGDVADVAQIARVRILRLLSRRGVVTALPEATVRDDEEQAEREPVLAQLAAMAVSGRPPAGPEIRRRPIELRPRGKPGVLFRGPRGVEEMGFSLHANTRAGALDEGAERVSTRGKVTLP